MTFWIGFLVGWFFAIVLEAVCDGVSLVREHLDRKGDDG